MSASVIGRRLGRAAMLFTLAIGLVAVGGTAASAADSGQTPAIQTGVDWN